MSPHDGLPPVRHRARPRVDTDDNRSEAPATAAEPSTYEVGYGKPPVHSRFQKGQSGNPKGRKKGSKNLDTVLTELLDERIEVNTPSGRRKISRVEMLVRKLIEIGAKGNPRAIDQILRQYALAQATDARRSGDAHSEMLQDVTETDTASLALLRQLLLAEAGMGQGGSA